jgi:hypothetical protein
MYYYYYHYYYYYYFGEEACCIENGSSFHSFGPEYVKVFLKSSVFAFGICLFKQLGWMSIEQRIKYHKYLLVSKCLKNEAPVYLKNKIQYLSM